MLNMKIKISYYHQPSFGGIPRFCLAFGWSGFKNLFNLFIDAYDRSKCSLILPDGN